MKNILIQGLEQQLVKDITQNYKESAVLRRRLVSVLTDKIEDQHKAACSQSLYDSPNWMLHQADKMGYERCLREIITLLRDEK